MIPRFTREGEGGRPETRYDPGVWLKDGGKSATSGEAMTIWGMPFGIGSWMGSPCPGD